MEVFIGKNFKVNEINTCYFHANNPICGHSLYVSKVGEKYKSLDDKIWVQDLGDIQNYNVFLQGIKYLDEYAGQKELDRCSSILNKMHYYKGYGDRRYCGNVAFFCDLGLWKDKDLCVPECWDKDFQKYLKNLLREYRNVLFS